VHEKPIDERSDIFSTGAVLFEMVTGLRLFDGNTDYETLHNVDEAKVPRASTLNSEVPQALDDILTRAMERDPSDRFQTASTMRAALAELRKGVRKATSATLVEIVEGVLKVQRSRGRKKRPRPSSDAVIIPLGPDKDTSNPPPSELPHVEHAESPSGLDGTDTDPLAALDPLFTEDGEAESPTTTEEISIDIEEELSDDIPIYVEDPIGTNGQVMQDLEAEVEEPRHTETALEKTERLWDIHEEEETLDDPPVGESPVNGQDEHE
jgi:serine/threonine protein kinase